MNVRGGVSAKHVLDAAFRGLGPAKNVLASDVRRRIFTHANWSVYGPCLRLEGTPYVSSGY